MYINSFKIHNNLDDIPVEFLFKSMFSTGKKNGDI